jgi:DNA/RNA endonuclease G (NUC1)
MEAYDRGHFVNSTSQDQAAKSRTPQLAIFVLMSIIIGQDHVAELDF